MLIPCQECRTEYAKDWTWFVCDTCGKRICHQCLATVGYKCNDCAFGYFKDKN
ncbi:hypothetical protein [Lottiidibacillus patelloidae]|uniref:hypothetical protein n=1 Tax=Lottiidibacillus patelloidae TaxID=2670334 RepID=UPI001302EB80|nr:hypothetical protein [Lottiidibacillus patelloidae]